MISEHISPFSTCWVDAFSHDTINEMHMNDTNSTWTSALKQDTESKGLTKKKGTKTHGLKKKKKNHHPICTVSSQHNHDMKAAK